MTKKQDKAKALAPLGAKGVIIRLERVEPGVVRVRLDDCERHKDRWGETWTFTHFDVAEERLRSMRVPKQRLHEIGLAVLARLIAAEDLKNDQ